MRIAEGLTLASESLGRPEAVSADRKRTEPSQSADSESRSFQLEEDEATALANSLRSRVRRLGAEAISAQANQDFRSVRVVLGTETA